MQTVDVVVIGAATTALSATERGFAGVTAATWHTLSVRIDDGATWVEFAVDGKVVYTYNGATAAVADVALVPVFVITEGTGAMDVDLDYIYVEMGRDN